MTPELFTENLNGLLDEAMKGAKPPIPRMLYELTMAHARLVQIQLNIEREQFAIAFAKKAATGIVPASEMDLGKLKINPPAGG